MADTSVRLRLDGEPQASARHIESALVEARQLQNPAVTARLLALRARAAEREDDRGLANAVKALDQLPDDAPAWLRADMAADLGIVCATSGLPARGLQLLDLADALHAYPPETPEWAYRLTDRSYMLNLADRHEDTLKLPSVRTAVCGCHPMIAFIAANNRACALGELGRVHEAKWMLDELAQHAQLLADRTELALTSIAEVLLDIGADDEINVLLKVWAERPRSRWTPYYRVLRLWVQARLALARQQHDLLPALQSALAAEAQIQDRYIRQRVVTVSEQIALALGDPQALEAARRARAHAEERQALNVSWVEQLFEPQRLSKLLGSPDALTPWTPHGASAVHNWTPLPRSFLRDDERQALLPALGPAQTPAQPARPGAQAGPPEDPEAGASA